MDVGLEISFFTQYIAYENVVFQCNCDTTEHGTEAGLLTLPGNIKFLVLVVVYENRSGNRRSDSKDNPESKAIKC